MKKGWKLLVWIVALQIIGSLMSMFTKSDINSWYAQLIKSNLTPPSVVFGITWSVLYVLIAIAGWQLWQITNSVDIKRAKSTYIAQLVLNWSWIPLFFHFQLTGMALVCLFFIILFTLLTMWSSRKISKVTIYLLLPYVLWCSFAAYLNAVIYFSN